ncbi:MAG TPA: hypothetical protein VJ783_25780 [Pirellulales bacterium]|nr:hypothetical protein [Pirellulales bacterium]
MEASSITGVTVECPDGVLRRAHVPCSRCGSYEWLWYADGSRKVECHGCGRLIGFDLADKRTGRRAPTTAGVGIQGSEVREERENEK